MRDLCYSLCRAILIASLIFQGVIGSAHIAFAAAAPDWQSAQVICSVYRGVPAGDGQNTGSPDEPGSQEERACPACASNHQTAGACLPSLDNLAAPALDAAWRTPPKRDQWRGGRKPGFANSRAPPRSV